MSNIVTDRVQSNKFYESVIDLKLYSNVNNLHNYLGYIFGSIDIKNKKLLDVGGGVGLLSFWIASNDGIAICLEPEFEGSSKNMQKNFNKLAEALSTKEGNPQLLPITFQEYQSDGGFDIIVLANSINHLNEEATINLQTDTTSYLEFKAYFKKMNKLLNPGGKLVITDCDKHNFFDKVRMKSPFVPTIEWQKHQHPKLWKKLIGEAGFEDVSISWTAPQRVGKLGRFLLGNRLIAFFLMGHFRIEATKPRP